MELQPDRQQAVLHMPTAKRDRVGVRRGTFTKKIEQIFEPVTDGHSTPPSAAAYHADSEQGIHFPAYGIGGIAVTIS
jgi:hypothetical protein